MNDINDLIRLHALGQATPEESQRVVKYLLDRPDGLSIMVNALREGAMQELNIDPSTDFLPEILAESQAFATGNREYGMASAMTDDGDIFEYLCRELLPE